MSFCTAPAGNLGNTATDTLEFAESVEQLRERCAGDVLTPADSGYAAAESLAHLEQLKADLDANNRFAHGFGIKPA